MCYASTQQADYSEKTLKVSKYTSTRTALKTVMRFDRDNSREANSKYRELKLHMPGCPV